VIPVTDEEHTIQKLAEEWVGCKLSLKLFIHRCSMRAPMLPILISHGPLLTILIAYGNIKHAGT
jgi:hypothetical protein